jgi:adenylate cyclase
LASQKTRLGRCWDASGHRGSSISTSHVTGLASPHKTGRFFILANGCTARFAVAATAANNAGMLREIRLACAAILAREGLRLPQDLNAPNFATLYLLFHSGGTNASLYEARHLLEQSLAIDPDARAYEMLSRTHLFAYLEGFDRDYLAPAALDRALELAQTAVRLDPRLPQAHAQLGFVLLFTRQHEAAIAEFERAFTLNPNFIDSRFAMVLIFSGEPVRAIKLLETNSRLDPFQQPLYSSGYMGLANYMLKRYGEAVRWLRECASRLPNALVSHLLLACAYAQSGHLEEARNEAAEVLRINPGFTIEGYKPILCYKAPNDVDHRLDGMRKAGLPES